MPKYVERKERAFDLAGGRRDGARGPTLDLRQECAHACRNCDAKDPASARERFRGRDDAERDAEAAMTGLVIEARAALDEQARAWISTTREIVDRGQLGARGNRERFEGPGEGSAATHLTRLLASSRAMPIRRHRDGEPSTLYAGEREGSRSQASRDWRYRTRIAPPVTRKRCESESWGEREEDRVERAADAWRRGLRNAAFRGERRAVRRACASLAPWRRRQRVRRVALGCRGPSTRGVRVRTGIRWGSSSSAFARASTSRWAGLARA